MAKILIADDSRFQLTLLKRGLEAKGFEVVTAEDGLHATMVALRIQPNAIILDLSMPGGSGLEVLRRLKNSLKTKSIPVIVLTANSDPAAREAAVSLGAFEFITKPVDAEQLGQILSKLTIFASSESHVAEAPASRPSPAPPEIGSIKSTSSKASVSWREILQPIAKEDREA